MGLANCVDGEVAAARGVFEVIAGFAFNNKSAMTPARFALASRQRNIQIGARACKR